MNKNSISYNERVNGNLYVENKRTLKTMLIDFIYLLKGFVLVANVFPVLVGFWLALTFTNTSLLDQMSLFLNTMIGSTLVISGALALNNWYEVDLDRAMDRTKKRPTVTGSFSLASVLMMGILFTILGFVFLFQTTTEAVIYSFIGWFTYVVLYTFWSKRKYTINTIIGAISGAVTPLIGWTVLAPGNHIVPITVAVMIFIWQMPHTYSIAMRRFEDYKRAGVAMLPVLYGFDVTKRQILVYVACLLPLPFFLWSLGPAFIIISTILNLGWLVLSICGLYTKNDLKWANITFIYSVNYMMLILALMMIVTW
ncbi:heme o synthase [Niallia sp. Krafla_26]|uniref:heme o synthase n=1 Tax=Niallia sp. Krafla_26 TaxID=3064703 RepID=UPI003D1707C7